MMNYIILDLEWNQSQDKSKSVEALPFEIIEVGALKISRDFEIMGEFAELVRPVVYPVLHDMSKRVTKIKQNELDQARSFGEVMEDFFQWCGEDYILCTWGDMDLTELQRNLEYFKVEHPLKRPLFYYDIQKLYSLSFDEERTQHSLMSAVEALQVPKKIPFHRASADTFYTALIMSQLDMEKMGAFYSIDYHHVPEKNQEIYLSFPGYSKFVSHEYEDKDALMEDRAVCRTECNICHRRVRQKIRWFLAGRNYLCVAYCPEHGLLKGKIRIRRSDNGGFYAIRTMKNIQEREAEEIRRRLDEKHQKKNGTS